jgi:hypothetical protein
MGAREGRAGGSGSGQSPATIIPPPHTHTQLGKKLKNKDIHAYQILKPEKKVFLLPWRQKRVTTYGCPPAPTKQSFRRAIHFAYCAQRKHDSHFRIEGATSFLQRTLQLLDFLLCKDHGPVSISQNTLHILKLSTRFHPDVSQLSCQARLALIWSSVEFLVQQVRPQRSLTIKQLNLSTVPSRLLTDVRSYELKYSSHMKVITPFVQCSSWTSRWPRRRQSTHSVWSVTGTYSMKYDVRQHLSKSIQQYERH